MGRWMKKNIRHRGITQNKTYYTLVTQNCEHHSKINRMDREKSWKTSARRGDIRTGYGSVFSKKGNNVFYTYLLMS